MLLFVYFQSSKNILRIISFIPAFPLAFIPLHSFPFDILTVAAFRVNCQITSYYPCLSRVVSSHIKIRSICWPFYSFIIVAGLRLNCQITSYYPHFLLVKSLKILLSIPWPFYDNWRNHLTLAFSHLDIFQMYHKQSLSPLTTSHMFMLSFNCLCIHRDIL